MQKSVERRLRLMRTILLRRSRQVAGVSPPLVLVSDGGCLVSASAIPAAKRDRSLDPIVSALARAARLGHTGIVIAPHAGTSPDDLRRLLGHGGVCGIVLPSGAPIDALPTDVAADMRLMRRNAGGGCEMPPAARHLYVMDPVRQLSSELLRNAVSSRAVSIHLAGPAGWLTIPLGLLDRIFPVLRRAHHLALATKAAIWRGRNLAGRLLATALPSRTALAARIAGPGGLGGGSIERVLDLLIARAGASRMEPVSGRILVVCGNLSPGGAERQVAYTVAGLAARGHHVTLLCHSLDPKRQGQSDFYLRYVLEAGAAAREIRKLDEHESPSALTEDQRQLLKLLPSSLAPDITNLHREIMALRPEVVHAFLDWDNIRAGIAAVIAGVPRILMSGRNINPNHFLLYQPYMDPAYRALARSPSVRILNNSRAGALDYARWIGIPGDRVRVIRNAIDFGDRRRSDPDAIARMREALGIPPSAFVVGGVFRLEEEKRPLLWVETAARIAAELPDAFFVIHGQGSLHGAIQSAIARHRLAGRIILPGVTSDVISAMSMFDLKLLTSSGEGLPNVLLEAQWAGTPVVCTDVGGSAEAIEPGVTGLALNTADSDALAAAVLSIAHDAAFRERAKIRGPQFVRERFSRDRMLDETLDAYGLS